MGRILGRLGLRGKIRWLTLGAIVLTTSGLLGLTVAVTVRQSRARLLLKGRVLGQMVAQTSEFGVYTGSIPELAKVAAGLQADSEIAYVRFAQRDGKVLLAVRLHDAPDVLPPLRVPEGAARGPDTAGMIPASVGSADLIDIVVPVGGGARDPDGLLSNDVMAQGQATPGVGVVQVGISGERARAELRRFLMQAGASALVLMLVGFVATSVLARRLTGPIEELVSATSEVAAGRLEVEIHPATRDELGLLAVSFQQMIGRLREYRAEVAQYQRGLEEKVIERTLALEETRQAQAALRKSHADLQVAQLGLIQAEKLESVGRLAAGVAHEVKNPLMTLLTGVKYLARRLGTTDDKLRVLLDDMAEAVTRADTVIRGLLDFAAPRKLELRLDDLNASVQRALGLVKHELNRGHITVVPELGSGLPPLMLDTFKIEQVLVNLLTNSVHATPAGGTIVVRTFVVAPSPNGNGGRAGGPHGDPAEPAVLLEVEDTGTGIPDGVLAKIFDPFFTTKPTGTGTGLGLSVSRQIVAMHGAEIDIRNRDEGGVKATIVFKPSAEGGANGKETHPAR